MRVSKGFFNITRRIHNALQGAQIDLLENEKKLYLDINKYNVKNVIELGTDIVIVHDPQPLAIRKYVKDNKLWIWRCHIDLSRPYKQVWGFMSSLLKGCNASVYHLRDYIHPETPTPLKYVIPASIDPLSDKNRELPWNFIEKTLSRYNIDPEKPILLQVARFDPWKDLFAAPICSYRCPPSC